MIDVLLFRCLLVLENKAAGTYVTELGLLCDKHQPMHFTFKNILV